MPKLATPLPVAVSATTAAKLLDCSKAHVYVLMERGALRRCRIAGSTAVRIPIEDIYAVLGLEMPDQSGGDHHAIA